MHTFWGVIIGLAVAWGATVGIATWLRVRERVPHEEIGEYPRQPWAPGIEYSDVQLSWWRIAAVGTAVIVWAAFICWCFRDIL